MSYSWQILKKELVRSVKGSGREEWKVAQTGILRKGEAGVGGVLLIPLESQHGTKGKVPG